MFSITYKPTRPEYRGSLGKEAFGMRRFKYLGENITFWQVKGLVDKIWSDTNGLNQRIQEILVENKHRLKPTNSKKASNFPSYVLRCYMVGPDEDHATPHAAIICDCKYLGSKSREAVFEHGVLLEFGWGSAFLHLNTSVLRLMGEDDDILHTMLEGSYEPRDEGAGFRVLCASLQLPSSPMGVGITTQSRDFPSNSATLGGLLKVDNELYGITVAHVFEEGRCHDITAEEDLSIELSTLDIYEGAVLQASLASEDVSASGQLQEIGAPHYLPADSAHCPDYALLNAKPEMGWTANFTITVQSEDSWQFHYPSHFATSISKSEANILVPTRYGVLKGESIQSVSTLSTGEPKTVRPVWTISLDDIEQGQCGSWVLDEENDQVLGILIAACPALSEAYILPMKDIVSDIVSKSLGTEVGLPEDPISLLHKSIITGHTQSMEAALSHSLDRSLSFRAEYGYSKIYQAAETGNLAAVKKVIERGDDLEEGRSVLTVSPVYEAVRLQQNDAAERLVKAGFDANQGVVMEEHSPLYVSIVHGHIDIAVALIEAGVQTDAVYAIRRNPPLVKAVSAVSIQVLEVFLDMGADVNQSSTSETKSAAEVEREYPNGEIRSAIDRAKESAKKPKDEKQSTEDDGDTHEPKAERA